MSSIRIQHGYADVTLEGNDVSTANGGSRSCYQPDDLVYATLRALRAIDSTRASILLAALEAGLSAREIDL